MEAEAKAELNKKAHSAVILCLGNKVLREVTGETTAAGVWTKLETLYMTKSLANKLYLKKKLYTFYMPTGRKISEHIDEFNKIVLDLANIEVKFEDEDLALLLLTSLPASYEHFVDTLLYGREALTLEDRFTSVMGKVKDRCLKVEDSSASICQSEDHSRETVSVMNIARSQQVSSKCDGGSVQLGDNRECKIRGIDKVRVQLRDGSSFVLHNVRYIPELKRNLISLGTLEKEGFTVKMQGGLIQGELMVLGCFILDTEGIIAYHSLDGMQMAGHISEEGTTVAGNARSVWQASVYGKLDFVDLCLGMYIESVSGLYSMVQHEAFGKVQRSEAISREIRMGDGLEVELVRARLRLGYKFCLKSVRHEELGEQDDPWYGESSGIGVVTCFVDSDYAKDPDKVGRDHWFLNDRVQQGFDRKGFLGLRLSGVETRMTGAKFDIEKFDGTGDFGLWRIKMRALLIQHGCEAALEVLPADMEAEAKAELNKKAHSAVILCLALDFGGVMATLNSKEFKERSRRVGDDGEGLYGEEELIDRICISQWESQDQSLEVEDSRCSYHMTPRLDIFFDFLECDGGSVQLGDNRECKIRGIGKVRVQLRDGSSFVLNNVRYIPELKRNLISLGTLEKEGFTVKMQSGKVKVINGSRVVLSGTRRDNCVYSLDGHAMAGELNASVEEKDSLAQVWHKRLGHISEAGLQVLEKQGLFGKKSLGKLDFCENCVLGKSHRVRFGVGRHTTQGVVDYIHSDLWGPSQVESLGGKRYFLSIIDDYSRRVWVYILRFKHEAFGKFKEWKQLVENQTGRTVKKLRTDNGLEFCNREFEQLCIESGIARHLTVAGTPQQNGLEVELQRFNNHTPEEDQIDQEDGVMKIQGIKNNRQRIYS
ncbi:retrovirus-related pol polyprotein from transposon TNT 1-94 [Tanacetum coccineum]